MTLLEVFWSLIWPGGWGLAIYDLCFQLLILKITLKLSNFTYFNKLQISEETVIHSTVVPRNQPLSLSAFQSCLPVCIPCYHMCYWGEV